MPHGNHGTRQIHQMEHFTPEDIAMTVGVIGQDQLTHLHGAVSGIFLFSAQLGPLSGVLNSCGNGSDASDTLPDSCNSSPGWD